jgi:hypothetical protein
MFKAEQEALAATRVEAAAVAAAQLSTLTAVPQNSLPLLAR